MMLRNRMTTAAGYNEVADMIARGARAKRITEDEFRAYREKVTDCIDDRIGAVDGGVFYVWLGQ